jgi:hypothetical protein
MPEHKLFMILLGCRPDGRLTEQHDIFFGIAPGLKELVPHIKAFWPEAKGEIHIDCWREVNQVNGHSVTVIPKAEEKSAEDTFLFFVNLGGYKAGEFEEYHYKMLAVGKDSSEAIVQSKKSVFYKHFNLKEKGGASHIDDKYGIDTDDVFKVSDALPDTFKASYSLLVRPAAGAEDKLHIGYLQIRKLI